MNRQSDEQTLAARRERAASASLAYAIHLAESPREALFARSGPWAKIAATLLLMPTSAFEIPSISHLAGGRFTMNEVSFDGLASTYDETELAKRLRCRYGLTESEVHEVVQAARRR